MPVASHIQVPSSTLRSKLPDSGRDQQKLVVVQSGARDAYQVARALSDAGMLERLVTDLYWPAQLPSARKVGNLLPTSVRTLLEQRNNPHLPPGLIKLCLGTGLLSLLLEKLPGIPASARRRAMRLSDRTLGRTAGRLANRSSAGLVSYSYYGYDAFREYRRGGTLFQLHPHPASMRQILTDELRDHPDCAPSLQAEWELALPEADFRRLVDETRLARRFLVASTFTRDTLIENGADPGSIRVIPYGVDLDRFSPGPAFDQAPHSQTPLRLLFVGRINQRKGIKYLLETMRLLGDKDVHLTVCGRVVDGLELFRDCGDRVRVRPSVSAGDLVEAYRSSDLFVFPSVAEGFGQVLLESLSSGLPILSTTRTAAPDLIDDGVQGFIVDPRRPDLLADRIRWAISHRTELASMRRAARARAEQFTWERFRAGVVSAMTQANHERNQTSADQASGEPVSQETDASNVAWTHKEAAARVL